MQRIRKGDEVLVIAGRDWGKRGVVVRVMDKRVIVEGVNMVKRHIKGNPMRGTGGGILQKEAPLQASNVALWNPLSERGDRVGFRSLEDGRKVRYFKSNGEVVDV